MFPESFPGGPLDERTLIYESLVADGDDVDDEASDSVERDTPTPFACLGCGTVTTAPDPPESCPACHRTPGDRRGGALFQPLE